MRPERKIRRGARGAGVVVGVGGRKRLRDMGVVVVGEVWVSFRRVPPKVLMVALVVKAMVAVLGVVVLGLGLGLRCMRCGVRGRMFGSRWYCVWEYVDGG